MANLPAGMVCRVHLLGPLQVTDAAGRDYTPLGPKVRALLALLALSPRGSRSRVWLRDKLWSDRREEQGGACLRQALSELRKALGRMAEEILVADKNTISLSLERVWIDVRDGEKAGMLEDGSDLLEGLDVGDPEFEDWLTLERQAWANRATSGAAPRRGEADGDEARRRAPVAPVTPARPGEDGAGRGRPLVRVGLLPVAIGDPSALVAVERVGELVAKSLIETGEIAVAQLGADASPLQAATPDALLPGLDYLFQTRLVGAAGSLRLSLTVQRVADRTVVWIDSEPVPPRLLSEPEPNALFPTVRRAVDKLLQLLVEDRERDGGPGGLVLSAVDAMFRLGADDLDRADRTLRAALATGPSAQASAWLAFLKTLRIGQRYGADTLGELDEAQALSQDAVAREPHNALVLALTGHVRAFLFGEYDVAADLFERAIAINPFQPLTWDLYAMTHAYIGRAPTGLACARWARQLGGFSPYRYYFDTSVCINACLAGRHEDAVRAGRLVLEERPGFIAALRFLVSSYAQLDEPENARAALERLERMEPDFSIAGLREAHYPLVRSGGGGAFLEGLIKAGVPRVRG